jgi:K+-sensing histidine kinase KdpD
MTDVTASMNYTRVRQRIDLLNSLQDSVSHDMKAPLNAIAKTMSMVL